MRFLFLWGALLLFVLRVVAGACVGRWTGQPRMPPRERQHEGLGGLGDLIRCARRAQERPFGAVTPLERRDEYYALFVFVGGAVAVCFEGCCGSMCWPVDRPATHAAAGAAARGALIGGVVVCSEGRCGGEGLTTGVVRHACRHRVTARGGFWFGGIVSHARERPANRSRRWSGSTRG